MKHATSVKKLSNGANVLFISTPAAESVYLGIYIRGGNRACSLEKHHVAHILEHAVFSGSKKYPVADDLLDKLEGNGASTNAETNNYYNKYEFFTTADELKGLLPVAIDMVYRPVLSQRTLAKEKEIIRNEIGERVGEIQASILNIDTMIVIPELEPPLEEQLETVEDITLKDVKDFHKRHYTTSNSYIIISGNIPQKEQDAYLSMLESELRDIAVGELLDVPTKEVAEDIESITPMTVPDDNGSMVYVSFNREGKPEDDTFAALKVFDAMIAGGLSGLLSRRLRDSGYVYSLETDASGSIELTSFSIATQVPRAKLGRFFYVLLRELDAILAGKFTDAALKRARQLVRSSLVRAHETPDGLADWYEMDFVLEFPLKSAQDRIKEIEAVKRRDIEALRPFFTTEKAAMFYATSKPEELYGGVVLAVTTAAEDNKTEKTDEKSITLRCERFQRDFDLTLKYESNRFVWPLSIYALLYVPAAFFVGLEVFQQAEFGWWSKANILASIPMLFMMAYFFYEPKIPVKIPFPRFAWTLYILGIIAFDTYYGVFIDTFDWDAFGGLMMILPSYLMGLWLGLKGPLFPEKYWRARKNVYPMIQKATEKLDAKQATLDQED